MSVHVGGRGYGHACRKTLIGVFSPGGTPATPLPDTTAPVLSLPTGVQTGPTTATVGATTDEGGGQLYWVITTSSTTPTAAQIIAGQNNSGTAAVKSGSVAVGSTGAKTASVTGLSASTAYYAHLAQTDLAFNTSNAVSSAQFTTAAAPDVTAPTLSSPTDAANGAAGATLAVTTNEATGTLYWFISTSATPPTATALKAGTGATSYGSQAVTATGVQNVTASGLAASTSYYSYFLHRDATGNDSTISAADGFTTSTVTAPVLTRTSTAGINPMTWSGAYTDMIVGIDYITMRHRVNGGSWVNSTNHLFTSDDYLDSQDGTAVFTWDAYEAATFAPGDLVEVQEGVLRDGVTTWSSILSDTMSGAAVTYAHGGTGGSTTSSTSFSFPTLTFAAGRYLVALSACSTNGSLDSLPTSLTLTPTGGGTAVTLSLLGSDHRGTTIGRAFGIYASAANGAGGSFTLSGTRPNSAGTAFTYGSVVSSSMTLSAGPTFVTSATSEANPHLTASLTCPANGLIIGWLLNESSTAGTVNTPSTFIAEVRIAAGALCGFVMGSRSTTGAVSMNTVQTTVLTAAVAFAAA